MWPQLDLGICKDGNVNIYSTWGLMGTTPMLSAPVPSRWCWCNGLKRQTEWTYIFVGRVQIILKGARYRELSPCIVPMCLKCSSSLSTLEDLESSRRQLQSMPVREFLD